MHCIVATNGTESATPGTPAKFSTVAGHGVSDYDADLAFGANGFSVLMMMNAPHRTYTDSSFGNLGQPIFNFVDVIQSGTYAGIPKNGWGLWNAPMYFVPTLRYYNAYDGADTSKYRSYAAKIDAGEEHQRRGYWCLVAFNKTASATTIISSINGAVPNGTTSAGTATAMGTPSTADVTSVQAYRAKVRWFHSVGEGDSPLMNACMAGAAGVWILNKRDFSQAQLDAITASLAAFTTAVETTYLANIVARSYAGTKPWKALHTAEKKKIRLF